MNHTPVHIEDYMVPLGFRYYHVIGTSTNEIAYCVRHDDAIRLVTACNTHEELLAALKGCLSWLSSYPGGGAMAQYDKVRKLLTTIEKGK